MRKKSNKVRSGINKRFTSLGNHSSVSNIIKIAKLGEHYIVVPSGTKNCLNKRLEVFRFAASDSSIVAKVEELLKNNDKKGGVAFVSPSVLGGDGEGVWPPFIPKDIKVCVKKIKINGINK